MSARDVDTLLRFFLLMGPVSGRRCVASNKTTARATLAELHALTRRGWITYDEDEVYRRLYGARGWRLTLTPAGREVAEAEMAKRWP